MEHVNTPGFPFDFLRAGQGPTVAPNLWSIPIRGTFANIGLALRLSGRTGGAAVETAGLELETLPMVMTGARPSGSD